MTSNLPEMTYSLHELRRLCRRLTREVREVTLGGARIRIHDIHPDLVPAGQPVHEHIHSFYEGHLFLHGGGMYLTGREEEVGRAGALVHGPHQPHAWAAYREPCLRLLIWFSMEPMLALTRPPCWPICEDLSHDAALLLDELHDARPGWHHRAASRVTIIISRLLSLSAWPDSPRAPAEAPDELVQLLEQFFRDNLTRPLALADAATHLGMSERTLCRHFTALTGETVMERLLNLRMEHAAALLADTNASIATICAQTGMPDPSYFSRRFHLHFDTTPARYRRRVKGEE